MAARKQGAPGNRDSAPADPIAVALATKPTARGRWALLPVDADEGEQPPRLDEGEEYTIITQGGELTEGVWATAHGCWGFELDGDDSELHDVAAVWLPSQSGPSGASVPEKQRKSEAVKLRLGPGYKARLEALARQDGHTLAEQVECWIEWEERRRAEMRAGRGDPG